MINFNFTRFISVIFLITNLNAGIIYVSDSGDDESGNGSSDNPYLTIQKGIDEASAMDTVMVSDGIYTGGVIINDKQISLIGESITDTKINVPITEPNISITETQDTVRIENFKIKRGNSSNGGGLYVYNSVVSAKNLDLSNNISSSSGGAINLVESSLKLENSVIYLNSSEVYGGAINCNSSVIEIIGSDLYNNSSGMGGAVCMDFSSICNIMGASFNSNGAENGGAIATKGNGKLTVSESEFYQNNANGFLNNSDPNYPNYGGGGAIYQEFADTLIISNTSFQNNSANSALGGAIASYHGGEIIFQDVLLRNNTSGGAGGGVAFIRPDNVHYDGGIIMDNRTNGNSGGGIFLGTESLADTIDMVGTFNHLVVANNWALYGGGGIMTWNATLELYNSTFSLNEATDNNGETSWQGGGLSIHAATTASIVNTIFYENIPNSIHDGTPNTSFDISYSVTEEFWNGDGNMTGDPQFVDLDSYDFRLQLGSPCIDAGTYDIDGDGIQDYYNFNGSAPDIGAIEWVIGAPELLTSFVNEQDSSVILTWNPIVNDDLQYYRIQRSSDSIFSVIDAEFFVTEISYTDESPQWNQEHFYRVSAYVGYWTDHSNTTSVFLGSLDLDHDHLLVNDYILYQNYPNPFNPTTTISYYLPERTYFKLTIYNMLGDVIKDISSASENNGFGRVKWNATNNQGELVSAGVYLYSIEAGEFRQTKKMVLLK